MSRHACPRCGFESSHDTWADRHPAAAVTLIVVVLAMCTAHPWLLAVIAVGAALYGAHRERRRREALAARADWEHRQLMAMQPAFLCQPVERPRRRAADHWSRTGPIRAGMGLALVAAVCALIGATPAAHADPGPMCTFLGANYDVQYPCLENQPWLPYGTAGNPPQGGSGVMPSNGEYCSLPINQHNVGCS
jgi:hypothetical protein